MNIPPPTQKQARVIWFAATALALAALLVVGAGIVWGLGKVLALLAPVLWPLAVAGVIAYLLDPVVDLLERRRVPRSRAIVLVFVVAFTLVLAVFASIMPRLVRETRELVGKIPAYSQRVQDRVESWLANPPEPFRRLLHLQPETDSGTNTVTGTNAVATTPDTANVSTNAVAQPLWSQALDQKTLASVTGWLAAILPNVGNWLFGQVSKVASLFGMLAGLALIPVYAFYFLLEKRGIARNWTDYLPVHDSSFKTELVFVLRSINDYLIAFFRGQVLVALCDGVLYTIGFFAIGLNYAFLIGFFAVFLTMIPFLGAFVTCTAALILAFVQFGDWLHPLLVLGVFGIVQTLEGLVISPKIMGDRVGLHPLTIIIAVMAGTTLLGGLLGGILAIPLTAALRVIMFRYVWKKRDNAS